MGHVVGIVSTGGVTLKMWVKQLADYGASRLFEL